ncbi:Protein phosphatase 2C (PP2C)-like domain protein [Kalmanozyma brasiliensis GHG001]|uniref:Protein phosphatase 2C (PP2C)-like domain protein n=1 Tax=Kalmanozyma brasiliensis (strain GHG001) TaxID=1365824 RepID=UPI002867CB1B|nr:Protein phosphatase 2C (PP2C)-like domain protein [Kalmanozyma brasiliensis GHG001]EST05672.2 Protein phosphatase 2C (PP2C)-like domain protein [Kalmanozyma brasiliensis GHG001]
MSKFPNHGLFTRTASASSRSTSLIAHARRGAPRRRSAAVTPSSSIALPTSNSAVLSGATLPTSQPSEPFIGPLTLAATQSTSSQTGNHPRPETATTPIPSTSEARWTRDPYTDQVLSLVRASENLPRALLPPYDNDSASTSSSLQVDASAHLPSSASISAAARHLARPSTSPFTISSFDRIPAHRTQPLYSIPHTRGVHIFYPNAAASHALSTWSTPSLDASNDVSALEVSTLSANRRLAKFNADQAASSSDYVPLWNVTSTSKIESCPSTLEPLSSDTLAHRMESLSFLSPQTSFPSLSSSASLHIPVNLLDNPNSAPSASPDQLAMGTLGWTSPDASSSASAWQSPSSPSSSKPSESSHSSSSSSSSRPPTPTVSARPSLATSTAQQDSSGSHGSGSSTPTQNNSLSPYQIESALLGPTSILTTAARGNYDQRRSASAAAATDSADASDASPLWTSSFASPKHRRLQYCFEHGAYGIPKRHPWAAVRGNGKRVQPAPPKPAARSGAVGMLAAAADFLTGSAAPSGPAAAKEKLGGDAVLAEDGRRLGLNSPIREHGRIVQDRLQSVQVGEDAYFLRPDSIGVADGVGGWASRAGADPALFSRLLMHFCAAELSKFDGLSADELAAQGGKKLQEWEQLDPVEVMHIAWERCVRASRREGILGSSTALLAVLRGDELRIANLGDCVLLIIRAGELLFRSTEQQHSFNFPVQLGMMGHTAESVTIAANRTLHRDGFLQSGASDDLDDNAPNPLGSTTPASLDEARKGIPGASSASDDGDVEEAEWDEPRRDAGRWAVKVQKGDIIIVGSDGLVDNLFDEDIVEEVLRFAPPRSSHQSIPDDDDASLDSGDRPIEGQDEYRLPDDFCPQLVSEALCSRAKAVSEDSRAVSSPFQQRAMEEGLHYVGGKHDDISVVVAVVGDPSERLTKASYSIRSEPEGDSETRSASGSA